MIKIEKKIITAINNPNLNNELKKEKYLTVIGRDLQYKEAILEMLEINKIDIIIINENLPGKIKLEELIKKIKLKNEKIKIILILEKENKEKIIKLNKINNIEFYFNNKINIKELIKIINEKEINKEELKEEIEKLENIIKENNYKIKNKEIKNNNKTKDSKINNNKINKKTKKEINKYNKKIKNKKIEKTVKVPKLISIEGESNLQNLIFSYLLAKGYNKKLKNKKILIIDFYFPEKNIFKNIENKNIKINNNKNKIIEKINNEKDNKKINIYEFKKLIINKINFNIDFFQNYYLINNIKNINNKLFQKISNQIKNNYPIIIINLEKNNKLNDEIIENSNINYLILNPIIEKIKENKKIINKYEKNKLKIIINKNNKQKINKEIIKKIFNYNKKINLIKIKKNNKKIKLIKKKNNIFIYKKIKKLIN